MLPIFITGNQNKADYLSKTLGIQLEYQKLDLDEIQSVNLQDIVEHKVRQAYEIFQKPVLVEDVSLSFDALGGLPGPFIKFFVEAENGLENLCRMLDGFDDRSAYASVMYGYYDGKDMEFMLGGLKGSISDHPRGSGGYGWDKIFEPDGHEGLTRAELSEELDLKTYVSLRDFDKLREFINSKRHNIS